jgi:hypothetical protein
MGIFRRLQSKDPKRETKQRLKEIGQGNKFMRDVWKRQNEIFKRDKPS